MKFVDNDVYTRFRSFSARTIMFDFWFDYCFRDQNRHLNVPRQAKIADDPI